MQIYLKNHFQIDEQTLPSQFRSVLRTSCEKGDAPQQSGPQPSPFNNICVGSLIPALAKQYPDRSTEFLILPHGLPEFKIEEDQGKLNANGTVLFCVKNSRFFGMVLY